MGRRRHHHHHHQQQQQLSNSFISSSAPAPATTASTAAATAATTTLQQPQLHRSSDDVLDTWTRVFDSPGFDPWDLIVSLHITQMLWLKKPGCTPTTPPLMIIVYLMAEITLDFLWVQTCPASNTQKKKDSQSWSYLWLHINLHTYTLLIPELPVSSRLKGKFNVTLYERKTQLDLEHWLSSGW